MQDDLLRDRARAMRKEPTEAERRLWSALRGHRIGGCKFRRQANMGPYIVDFVCFAHKLVIELDGSQHAESTRDAKRDGWFRERGYEVLRFWNGDVLANRDGVLFAIATKLGLGWVP